MSETYKVITLQDELTGLQVGNEGSAVYVTHSSGSGVIKVSLKYAAEFEDDPDGWEWALGSTHLNINGITDLRDWLTEVLDAGL